MNKFIYAAPFLAALTLSYTDSAQAVPTFSAPSFFQDLQTLASNFTDLQGDITAANTDTQTSYQSSISGTPGSYESQLGLFKASFDYCVNTNPSPCTAAELAIAQQGESAYQAALALIGKLPPATSVEGTMTTLYNSVGTLDSSDITSLENQLTAINSAATGVQGLAAQLASSSPGADAAVKKKLAAMNATK